MSNGEVVKACLACGEKATSRGLCRACYTIARLRVNSNLTTWEWLEKNNLALPSTKKEKVSKFSEAFDAAKEAEQHQLQNAANVAADLAAAALNPVGYDADGNLISPQGPPQGTNGVPQTDPARIQAIEDEKSAQHNVQHAVDFAPTQPIQPQPAPVQQVVRPAPVQPEYYAPPPAGVEIPGRQTVVPQQPSDIPARPWAQ